VCELQGSTWFTSEKEKDLENELRYKLHKEAFDDFLKEFNLTDLTYTKETPRGKPAEEILGALSRNFIDLLIMGTTGRTGLNRVLMGSVTEKVVREVPCSFLTLKSEDVIALQFENNLRDIEQLYGTAMKLMEDGFYREAIAQLKSCLTINNMHVPAYQGLAKIYDKLNEPEKAIMHRKNAKDIMDKLWYQKIEEEVRKLRGS